MPELELNQYPLHPAPEANEHGVRTVAVATIGSSDQDSLDFVQADLIVAGSDVTSLAERGLI